ncbi:MAG TPA: Flp family type IVb pilin [Polyangia bacterium]|nr:Flp family type IVb pilin [Polyangia bacterium]
MTQDLRALLWDDEGADATEYALVGVLVAIGIIAVLVGFRNQLRQVFTDMTSQLGSAR